MSGLVESEIDFEMAMSGEVFVSVRPPYAEVTEMLADRLVYPERIEQFAADQSESLFNSPETVVDLMCQCNGPRHEWRGHGGCKTLSWVNVAPLYDEALRPSPLIHSTLWSASMNRTVPDWDRMMTE